MQGAGAGGAAAARAAATALTLVAALSVAGAGCGSSGRHARATPTTRARPGPVTTTSPPAALTLRLLPWRLPQPIAREAAVVDRDAIMLMGGLDATKSSTTAAWRIDPRRGTATRDQPLPVPVHDTAGALVTGTPVALGGGNTSERPETQAPGAVIGRLPQPRADLAAVTVGSDTIVAGGFDGRTLPAGVLSTRDARTFSTIAELPVPVRYPAATVLGSEVVVIGGETASGAATSAIQVVDLQARVARVAARLEQPVAHAVAVTLQGQVYLVGGIRSGTRSARVVRLDVASGAIVDVARMTAPLSDAAAVVIGSTAYVLGGEQAGPTATVWAFGG